MLYPVLLIIGDFLALLAAFTLAYVLRVQVDPRPLVAQVPAASFIKVFLALIPFWLIINAMLGLYNKDIYEKRLSELPRLLAGAFIGILLIIGFDFVKDEPLFPARLVPVYGFLASFAFLALERILLWQLRRYAFRYGYGVRNVMIIGSTDATTQLGSTLSVTRTSGYHIKAVTARQEFLPEDFKGVHFSSLDSALEKLVPLNITTIFQTEFFEKPERNQKILAAAREHHIAYRFIPLQSEFFAAKNTVEVFHGFPMIAVHQTSLIGWGRLAKRFFDIIGAGIGLVIATPIVLVVGLVIMVTDGWPIIYRHKRVARWGQPFYVYKLRSMYRKYSTGAAGTGKSDEEIFREMGREDLIEEFREHQKVKKDPRVMPIGRFIRATSLDELPQLWNVLRGDLSLVGPRPIVKEELKHYKHLGPTFLAVKPGMTGLWQVSGRSDLSYEDRVKLDIYYVQNWSFWLDVKILLKTVVTVLRKAGAR